MSNEQNATPGIEGVADRYVRQHTINILYTNHRGETARRRIQPLGLRFGVSARHPDPQWLLEAIDLDKNAERSFALSGLRGDVSETVPPRKSLIDQIHAVKEFAKRWGYPELAEWLTKHADEPCTAAIAQFIGVDAEASEPRGLSPHNPANGRIGGAPESIDGAIDRIEKELSAAPASEPPRTEAVKEAIRMVERLVELQYPFYPLPTVDGTKLMPLVAALADAEQERDRVVEKLRIERTYSEKLNAQLAEAERKLAEERTVAHGIIANLRHETYVIRTASNNRIAAAEKRAKDAEDGWRAATTHPRGAFCAVFSWPHGQRCSDNAEERYAALTRKLATAREGIECAMSAHGDPGSDHEAVNAMWKVLSTTLAAIDAPAAEEAAIPPGGKCPECGGVTYGTREVHLSDCSRWMQPVAPEPANAQGSEADGPPEPHEFCGGDGCDMCKAPSARRFTAEEAREEAAAAQRDIRNVSVTWLNATLLAYADLLEHDDALERAAKAALEILERCRSVFARNEDLSAIENLRSVLAQRAKGKS